MQQDDRILHFGPIFLHAVCAPARLANGDPVEYGLGWIVTPIAKRDIAPRRFFARVSNVLVGFGYPA